MEDAMTTEVLRGLCKLRGFHEEGPKIGDSWSSTVCGNCGTRFPVWPRSDAIQQIMDTYRTGQARWPC